MTVLATMGFIGARQYTDRQILLQTTQNVASALKLARSRAQTQVKPSECTAAQTLLGYRVDFICSGNRCTGYRLTAVCNGREVPDSNVSFPSEIQVTTTSQSYFFRTISGSVNTGGVLLQLGSGDSESVLIYEDGRITIDET